MPDLAPLTAAYQASLEHHRSAVEAASLLQCEDEVVEQLAEDLSRAKRALEVAYWEQNLRP